MVTEQLKYPEALEQLRVAYEHEKIVLTSQISTLQLSVNQQSIKIKKLEERKMYDEGVANGMADVFEFIKGYLKPGVNSDSLIPALQNFIIGIKLLHLHHQQRE